MIAMTEVYFKKPNFKQLADLDKTVVDMHYHTKYSQDSIATPRLIVKKAKKLGIGVAITDHNSIKGAKELWKSRNEVRIIPGIEITDATCIHTIVYFYDLGNLEDFYNSFLRSKLYKMPFFISKNLKYVLESARDYGNCVVCMPHPFTPGPSNIQNAGLNTDLLNCIDLVEVINSFNLRARNKMALDFANKINKGMTGGSDGHSIGELGSAVTVAEGESNEEFMTSLIKKRSMIVGRESNVIKKLVQTIGRETTSLRKNIFSKSQINRMRAHFYVNQQNLKARFTRIKK